jgi:hypothetical protein
MARSEVAPFACNSVPPREQRRLLHWLLRPSGGLRGELRAKTRAPSFLPRRLAAPASTSTTVARSRIHSSEVQEPVLLLHALRTSAMYSRTKCLLLLQVGSTVQARKACGQSGALGRAPRAPLLLPLGGWVARSRTPSIKLTRHHVATRGRVPAARRMHAC